MKLTFGDTQPPESENKWEKNGKKGKKGGKKEKRGDEKRGKEDEKGIMTPGGKEDKIG